MKTILNLKKIYFKYFSKNGQTDALQNINLKINEGEFIAIVGPSGCGKTTILSLISGLLKATSGNILINKKEVTGVTNQTGYMFQHDHLFDWLTVYKNITLGLELQHNLTKETIKSVNDLLKKYGLEAFKNNYPKELSGGMRQRVALIRTLALNPKILLLDEPFSALDFQTRLEACNDVSQIIAKENKTAIFVTHDIGEAISMADKVIVLTKRPGTIKCCFDINLKSSGSPLKRREHNNFAKLFEQIYKELRND